MIVIQNPRLWATAINEWNKTIWDDIVPTEQTFACISHDSDIMGSVCLVENDLPIVTGYSPWLANLYTRPIYRNMGVAKLLITTLMSLHNELYLYTESESLVRWYKTLGWTDTNHIGNKIILKHSN